MRVLEITLVAVLFTVKTIYSDGILPPHFHTKSLPYTITLKPIQDPAVLPEFLSLWKGFQGVISNIPTMINNITRLVDPQYEEYKNDLLSRIQKETELVQPRVKNPRFKHRTHTTGFNGACVERNQRILMNKIEDYYNQTIKSLCSENINHHLSRIETIFVPTLKEIVQRIENVQNLADIEAFKEYFSNIVVEWLRAEYDPTSDLNPQKFPEQLEMVGKCLYTVNDLLAEYVLKENLLMDCRAEDEVNIDSAVLNHIHEEIRKFWNQVRQEASRTEMKNPLLSTSEQLGGIIVNVFSNVTGNIASKLSHL